MKYINYKEERNHGTIDFPIEFYHVTPNHPRYEMSYHWHIEYELIRVLKGKLLMTTFDINNNLNKRIVARQLRKSILEYMSSNEFKPEITLDIKVIRDLFEKEATKVNMFTKDSPDELKPKIIR